MTELKKNQELQEYIRLLENKMHRPESNCKPVKVFFLAVGLRTCSVCYFNFFQCCLL